MDGLRWGGPGLRSAAIILGTQKRRDVRIYGRAEGGCSGVGAPPRRAS